MQDVTDIASDEDAMVDVRVPELEIRIALERLEVLRRTRDEVVEREHAHAALEKSFAQVRADEAGAARDDRARLIRGQRRDR